MQQKSQSAKPETAKGRGVKDSGSNAPRSAGNAAAEGASTPAGTPSGPPPSQRGGRILLIGLAVIAVAALGYRYMVASDGGQQAAVQAGAPPAPQVSVAKPLIETLREWRDYTGQFEARESVEIRARVDGYLESVNFTDGQLVNKGDLLFVIEPRPFEIALDQAKAQLDQSEAQLQLAKVQLERTTRLLKNDYASQQAYDERAAEVKSAAASRDNALAVVNQAQLNLDYTRVVAPVSGRVGRHEVSVGNLVVGGSGAGETTLLTTIVSLDPIWLLFNVSEGDGMTYKRLIQKGEVESARSSSVEVEGQLMDERDWPLKGKIDFVDNQYSRSSGTIRVRASFPNPDLFITPGQFGRVRVPMSQEKPTMLVPDSAVVTDQSVKLLFTVSGDGVVVPKQIELGPITDGGLRIIRSGVTPDDDIIVNGLLRARPGQKVTPEPSEIKVQAAAAPGQE